MVCIEIVYRLHYKSKPKTMKTTERVTLTRNGCTFAECAFTELYVIIRITPINGVFTNGDNEKFHKVERRFYEGLNQYVNDNF